MVAADDVTSRVNLAITQLRRISSASRCRELQLLCQTRMYAFSTRCCGHADSSTTIFEQWGSSGCALRPDCMVAKQKAGLLKRDGPKMVRDPILTFQPQHLYMTDTACSRDDTLLQDLARHLSHPSPSVNSTIRKTLPKQISCAI